MKHPKTLKTPSFPHASSGNPVTLRQTSPGLNSLALRTKTACGIKVAKYAMRRITTQISAKTVENPLPRFGEEGRQLVTNCHRLKLPFAKSSYFHFGTNCQRIKSKITEANRVSQAGYESTYN